MPDTHPMLKRYVIPDMPSVDDLLPHLKAIDSNLWYSNFGPLVGAFEARLLEQIRVHRPEANLVTLMTCYDALRFGIQAMHLPPNANVLIPAVTFPACPLAVQHGGAQPVLADVDPVTWQLTPEIARLAAQKMPLHAVMPVAVYGVPVYADAWDQFSADTGIPVIIDGAAAYGVQKVPQKGLVAYSFHATKPFCTGEGGALVGTNAEWIEEARVRSNFGTVNRITIHDGTNAKMCEYHAAAGLAQFDRWEGIKERRRRILGYYRTALADRRAHV